LSRTILLNKFIILGAVNYLTLTCMRKYTILQANKGKNKS